MLIFLRGNYIKCKVVLLEVFRGGFNQTLSINTSPVVLVKDQAIKRSPNYVGIMLYCLEKEVPYFRIFLIFNELLVIDI